MGSYFSTMASTQIIYCTASSKEYGSIMTHPVIRAMYPMYLFGDLLYFHCDVGVPTFSLASNNNLSASLVSFLPSLEDSTSMDFSTPESSACGYSTSI